MHQPFRWHKWDEGDRKKRRQVFVAGGLLSAALMGRNLNDEQKAKHRWLPYRHDDPTKVEQAVQDFMTRHRLHGRITLHPFEAGEGAARYSGVTNDVHYPNRNRFAALHELGHAADMAKFSRRARATLFGRAPLLAAKVSARALTYPLLFASDRFTEQLKGDRPEGARGKFIDFVRNHPAAVIGVGHLQRVGMEGTAWLRALRHLHRHEGKAGVKAGLKYLHVPYGSYLAPVLLEMAGVSALQRLRDWRASRKRIEQEG